MELKATRYEIDGHVATVWLHRPHRHNAWTGRMHSEYLWVLARLEADPAVRVIVVTGTPPAFCVGADSQALAGHAERGTYDTGLADDIVRPVPGLRADFDHDFAFQFGMRAPIIAAVNGACAGIGLALAMFCDLRFASAAARLTTAAPKLGLPAEYGLSWMLPRLIGVTRANDLLLSGRVFTPGETESWGMWNGVLPDGDETVAAALSYARMLVSSAGPEAMRVTKEQIYTDLASHDVGASIITSKRLLNEAMGTAEYREGAAALRDKRPPQF
jgi:enoyl-CoA hydratase/carnithine racemase